jgi:hypothetical protein
MHISLLWYFLVISDEALENLWLVFHIPCFEIAVKLEAFIQTVLVLVSEVCNLVFGITDNIVLNTSQSTEWIFCVCSVILFEGLCIWNFVTYNALTNSARYITTLLR